MNFEQFIRANFNVQGTSGDEIVCKCPWHDDGGKPNLYINSKSGLYLCHACGAKGHLRRLQRTGDMPLTTDLKDMRARLQEISNPPAPYKVYGQSWLDQFGPYNMPHEYWTDRGFSEQVVRRFKLGYDPVSDRCTIPIRSAWGEVMGVIQRVLDDSKPKYLHPKGFKIGRDLYGSWLVRKGGFHRVALVEGPLDAVACWDAKVPAMGLHGARLTDDQAALIRSLGVHTVVAMTDNDDAGYEAVVSIKEQLSGIQVLVGQYRTSWNAKDPGELHPRRRRQMFLSAPPYHKVLA